MGCSRVLTASFLCDGNQRVGLGHTSRSLGLAEALRDRGFDCQFVGDYDAAGVGLIQQAGFPIGDRSITEESAALVVDSYQITESELEHLRDAKPGRSLTIVDDFALLSRYPDGSLIVNFTVGADACEYRGRDCMVLRGPGYLLVREAVASGYGRRPHEPPRRVLVAIGGYDRSGFGSYVTSLLEEAGVEVEVVTGASRPHLANE